MIIKDWKKELFTIPNALSLFRLVLIPVYVIIYLNAKDNADYFLAAGILAVSCLTDMIDGQIARHFNMITNLGKILDPVADKATQITLIICLSLRYPVLWFIVALFVVKESFQLIAGGLSIRKGKMLTGALISGKICTTILFVSLIVMVMLPSLPIRYVNYLAMVDAVFMIVAFTEYVIVYCGKKDHFQAIELPERKKKK